jgi:hypothetical protein
MKRAVAWYWRLVDWYSRDYVRWAVEHRPISWLLELAGFAASAAAVWFTVGTSAMRWVVLAPIALIFLAWTYGVARAVFHIAPKR